ncbi:hypothetical protein [Pandoraea sp. NPDC087047]|uniref:hypothetical protein n=1 Tax=Pandoraea sp. NPDC087047 TaxID=3364390 RepID=UPI0038232FF5
MAYVTPSYRGYRLETFVFRDQDAAPAEHKHDRTLAVSVRISQSAADDPASPFEPKLFRLESVLFDAIGDARRAGDEFGRSLVDDIIHGNQTEV